MSDQTINYDEITFVKPIMQGDRYFVKALMGTERIITQFNRWMTCKTEMVCEDGKPPSQVEVIIPGKDGTVSPFIEYMSDFEDAMLKTVKQKKDEWFPDKDISDEWLDQAFHSGFKQVKKSTDATAKLRISKELLIYTSERKETGLNDIHDGSKIAVIIHMDGIWFTKSRFGLTWKVVQIKVHKDKEPSRMYMFDDDAVPEPDLDNVFPDDM